jgi:hypothetical protein
MLRRIRRSSTLALLLSPVGILFLAATRLLIVSDYNLNTALAILSSGGYVNTLLGTVIPLVPVIMPYLALLLLYLNRVVASLLAFLVTALISPSALTRNGLLSLARHDWHMITVGTAGWRVGVIILLAIPFTLLLLIELLAFDWQSVTSAVLTVAVIALLPLMVQLYPVPGSRSLIGNYYVNLVSQPWLPAETITLTTNQVVVGYPLGSDGFWLEVMQASNRAVVHYRMSQIAGRFICQMGQIPTTRPLITLIPAHSETQQCAPSPSPVAPAGTPPWGRSAGGGRYWNVGSLAAFRLAFAANTLGGPREPRSAN